MEHRTGPRASQPWRAGEWPNGYACDGITRNARRCKRSADRHYETAQGVCVAHYCAQHAAGAGPTRLLRPFAWEYDQVRVYA
jgi:hypothetical protein